MKVLHTSDWHLGHTLHNLSREFEHAQFLGWLLDTLVAEAIDALLITGDIFDTHNPGAAAQKAWYGFLAAAKRRSPRLQIVIIGGNHDSAERLNAPQPLMAGFDIHVVGGLPRRDDDSLDTARLVIPLQDAGGQVAAWVVAVPFLRGADLRGVDETSQDSLQAGVGRVYAEAIAAARAQQQPGQAVIATGHCYMAGGRISELSERKIQRGNEDALPVDIFPDDLAYVALGHLHRAQAVGREHVRYAGSPLPLSITERDYQHQAVLLELEGGKVQNWRPLTIPRSVGMLRIPAQDALPLNDLLKQLKALPALDSGGASAPPPPFLEVAVRLDAPEPALRHEIDQALADRAARLVSIKVTTTAGPNDHGRPVAQHLAELAPADIFAARYRQAYASDPPDDLRRAFYALVERAQGETDTTSPLATSPLTAQPGGQA